MPGFDPPPLTGVYYFGNLGVSGSFLDNKLFNF